MTELSREEKAKIENSRIRGSLTDGICFGATLWVLKLLLTSNPQSESKLIDLLRPFEKGFPAEAAALQHHAFSHRDFEKEEMSLDEVKQELDKIDQKN
ncbi:MAG: hypothetical protein HWD61_04020 [Parachlamydiaceae bacterium]|nr:MAG: hypothetical protein HWD61_04020 [Parachlamydiaceae bacterium]